MVIFSWGCRWMFHQNFYSVFQYFAEYKTHSIQVVLQIDRLLYRNLSVRGTIKRKSFPWWIESRCGHWSSAPVLTQNTHRACGGFILVHSDWPGSVRSRSFFLLAGWTVWESSVRVKKGQPERRRSSAGWRLQFWSSEADKHWEEPWRHPWEH